MFPYLSGLFFQSQDRLDVHEVLTKTLGALAIEMGGNDYNKFGNDFETVLSCSLCNHKWISTRSGTTVGANMCVLDVGIDEKNQGKNSTIWCKISLQ